MAPARSSTWSEAMERRFLSKLLEETGTTIPMSVYKKVAEDWGEPHTANSLTKRFKRMKEANDKAIEAEGNQDMATGTGGGKRKAGDEGADVEVDGAAKPVKKPKKAAKGTELKNEEVDGTEEV